VIIGCKYDKVTHADLRIKVAYVGDKPEDALVFVEARSTLGGEGIPPATVELINRGEPWSEDLQDIMCQLVEAIQIYTEERVGDPAPPSEALEVPL